MIGDVQVTPRAAGGAAGGSGRPAMRFSVDGWDPTYGTSLELEDYLGESTARVEPDVELPASQWRAVDPDPGRTLPAALLFVDGVRRIEARVWIDDEVTGDGPATEASAALCASYAAGVVCCCDRQAHVVLVEARRGLFTVAPHASDIGTWAGEYTACRTTAKAATPLTMTLSQALQRRLAEVEVNTAVAARAALPDHGVPPGRPICWSSTARCAGASTCPAPSATSSPTAPPTCRPTSTRWSARLRPASAPRCS